MVPSSFLILPANFIVINSNKSLYFFHKNRFPLLNNPIDKIIWKQSYNRLLLKWVNFNNILNIFTIKYCQEVNVALYCVWCHTETIDLIFCILCIVFKRKFKEITPLQMGRAGVPPALCKPDPVAICLMAQKTPCSNFEICTEFN